MMSIIVAIVFLIIATYLIVVMRNLEVNSVDKSSRVKIDYDYKETVTKA
jgi:hypothetical protein